MVLAYMVAYYIWCILSFYAQHSALLLWLRNSTKSKMLAKLCTTIILLGYHNFWLNSCFPIFSMLIFKQRDKLELTRKGDVKSTLGVRVISKKLQPCYVSTCGDRWWQNISRKAAQNGWFSLSPIFDRQKVKLLFHAQVIKGQVDPALGLSNDQPHTVHVVPVLLRVVGWEQYSRWCSEVEEAGDWGRWKWSFFMLFLIA